MYQHDGLLGASGMGCGGSCHEHSIHTSETMSSRMGDFLFPPSGLWLLGVLAGRHLFGFGFGFGSVLGESEEVVDCLLGLLGGSVQRHLV